MSALPIDPALQGALRLFLSTVFALAALHKLRDRAGFRLALRGYALLPEPALPVVGVALPLLELSAVAALLGSPAPAVGVGIAASLLLLYSAAIGVNLLRGRRDIDCGCGGPAAGRTLGADLLGRNALLLGALALCAPPPGARPLVWVDGLTVVAGAASLALLYAAAEAGARNVRLGSRA